MSAAALLRPRRRTLALLIAALILLVWVARAVTPRAVLAALQQLTPVELLALLAINLLIFASFAGRWWVFLRAQGHAIAYTRLLAYRLTAFGISYFTPGPHFGGEPYQVLAVVRGHQTPPAAAIAAVTLDKVLEMLVNFAFLAAGVLLLLTQGHDLGHILGAGPAVQLAVYLLLLLALPAGLLAALGRGRHPLSEALRRLDRLAGRLPKRQQGHAGMIPPIWLVTLRRSEAQAGLLCREHPRALWAALAVSFLSWLGVIGEFWLLTAVLGLQLTPVEAITALVAARLAILLPLPAGLGALEAGLALATRGLGLDPSIGVALSLLIRARDTLFGLLGLWLGSVQLWQLAAPMAPDLGPPANIDRQNPASPA